MATDFTRMIMARIYVERIECLGFIQSSIYPCSSLLNPCPSVDNSTPQRVKNAVDRCMVASSQDRYKTQHELVPKYGLVNN
jgi:hypothetical protein